MKRNKILISFVILFIMFGFVPNEIYAAKQPKSMTDEQTLISYINLNWWKEYNDEILTNYLLKAVKYNQDLKISSLKVEEATQNKNLKRANEMPSIGVGAVPALYKLPGVTNSDGLISLPIYANYELDLFGKNRDKTKAMDKLTEVSRLNEKSSYISVISAVGSVYFNIVKLDKIIDIQEQIINDRKNIYELMKLSNEQGLVSTADTVSANKAYIKSNSDMIELKKNREKLLNMLAVLTGDTPENSSDYNRISFDDLNYTKIIPQYISSEVIQNRPDYLASEKLLEKAGLDIRIAKKEFLPSFNILGLISFNSTDFLSKMDWKNSVALLGGGALLPLFTGGSRIANLKLQKNKYEQMIQNYAKTNLTAIQEVNDSLSDLKLDNEKYNKTIESLKADKLDYYYTNLKFNEGIISKLDLLQKHESLLTTEKRAVSDKSECIVDEISLYKAVAGDI